MINKQLPIYEALISDENDGIYAVSLVTSPATQSNWTCFSEDQNKQLFSIQDNDQHLLTGVIMLANTPIYRIDETGYEYNIVYKPETIKLMSQKMLSDGTFNNIDIQHDGELLSKDKVKLVELYIVDREKGIAPTFMENIPDGSLIGTYKIFDDVLWNECKLGNLHGFSLAGMFGSKLTNEKFTEKNIKMFDIIKNKIKEFLLEFSNVNSDKGQLFYKGEIAEGISLVNEDGQILADGDYVLDNGQTISVKDGLIEKIAEAVVNDSDVVSDEVVNDEPIVEPKAETEQTEDVSHETISTETEAAQEFKSDEDETEKQAETEDQAPEKPEVQTANTNVEADVNELKTNMSLISEKLSALENTVKTISEGLQEIINKPAVEPIKEQYSNVEPVKTKGKLTAADYLAYMNK